MYEVDTLIVAVGYKKGSAANIREVKMAPWSPKMGLEVIPESRLQRIQLGLLWLANTEL